MKFPITLLFATAIGGVVGLPVAVENSVATRGLGGNADDMALLGRNYQEDAMEKRGDEKAKQRFKEGARVGPQRPSGW